MFLLDNEYIGEWWYCRSVQVNIELCKQERAERMKKKKCIFIHCKIKDFTVNEINFYPK